MSGVIPEGYKKGRRQLYPENPDIKENIPLVQRAEGWDLPFGSPERMEFMQERRYEQAQSFIESEMQKPESERFMPSPKYNPLSLDALSTGEYLFAAGMGKLAYGDKFNFRENFMKKGEFVDVVGRGEKETLERIKTGELGYLNPYDPKQLQAFREQGISSTRNRSVSSIEEIQNEVKYNRFIGSMVFDPISYATMGTNGLKVAVNGKKVALTDEGTKVLSAMLQKESVKNSKLVLYRFSRMIQENPKLYSALVQKEGLRVVWTNLEIIPKQFMPHIILGKGISKGLNIGKGAWDTVATAFNRQYATILSKFPKKAVPPPPLIFNEIRAASKADYIAAKARVDKQVADLISDAKKQLGDKFDLNLLSEYAENPSIRASLKSLDPIYQRWETIRKTIASIEKANGVLHNERDNYLRHYLTYAAKKAKGIVTGVKQKAGFNIARRYDGSIAAENFKSITQEGYKIFDDNFGRIIQKRLYEHESVMNSIDLINKVDQQFGKTAKEVAGNKNYVQSLRNPNIYIPKEIAQALKAEENVKNALTLTGYKTKYEIIKDTALIAPRAAYNFQRWTLHTWEKLQTRGFPAFYAVNYYGGKFMAWLGGAADVADDAAAIAVMRKSTDPGKVIITSELDPRIKYTKEDLVKIAQEYKLTKVDPLGVASGKLEQMTGFAKIGWTMEEELRTSIMWNRLRKGDTPEEAYKYVIKYQFDYTSELQGADKILQDWIPFYRWQRNAIPFFASQTIESYGKMRAFGVMAQSTWYSPEAEIIKPYIPDWAESRINIFMGGNRNDIASVNLPIGTVPDTLRKLNSVGNATQLFGPAVQIPYQLHTGKETFTGQNITDPIKFIPKVFLNRHISTMNKITNRAPAWEVGLEGIAGVNIMQGNDLMYYAGAFNDNSRRMASDALRRLNGRWHGCGF